MMTNGDPKGGIFLFHPHTNNGFLFFLTIGFLSLDKLPEIYDYAEM